MSCGTRGLLSRAPLPSRASATVVAALKKDVENQREERRTDGGRLDAARAKAARACRAAEVAQKAAREAAARAAQAEEAA